MLFYSLSIIVCWLTIDHLWNIDCLCTFSQNGFWFKYLFSCAGSITRARAFTNIYSIARNGIKTINEQRFYFNIHTFIARTEYWIVSFFLFLFFLSFVHSFIHSGWVWMYGMRLLLFVRKTHITFSLCFSEIGSNDCMSWEGSYQRPKWKIIKTSEGRGKCDGKMKETQ